MTLIKCADCGMPKSLWTRNAGEGFEREGLLYCCQGCAEYSSCTCRVEADQKRPWMPPPTEMFSILNHLIEVCLNTEYCYRTVSQHLKNEKVKRQFARVATQRAQFAADLQKQVRNLGGDPDRTGTVRGMLHRRRVSIETDLTAGSLKEIFAEYERAEKQTVKVYDEAVRIIFPSVIHSLLKRQSLQVHRVYDRIRRQSERLGPDKSVTAKSPPEAAGKRG